MKPNHSNSDIKKPITEERLQVLKSAISAERLEKLAADPKASYPVQQSMTRDGLYEDEAMFLIYEPADVKYIVSELGGGNSET